MKVFFSLPFLLIYGLLLVSVLVHLRLRRSAIVLLVSMMASLYLLCTPWLAHVLMRMVAITPPLEKPQSLVDNGVQAIVVAGGGDYFSPETGSSSVAGGYSLPRLRYAARLARQSGLPVLLTGIEASAMARTLDQDYGLKAAWVESESLNTAENADRTAAILLPLNINRVALVTDAWHMSRASFVFKRHGFLVTPAATSYPLAYIQGQPPLLLPRNELFAQNMIGISELLGQVLYRIKFRSSPVPSPAPSAIPVS